MEPRVDEYIAAHPNWAHLLHPLREILLSAGLEETVKWGMPAYTWKNKNVVGLAAFKGWATLWFHQGALLADEAKVLINAQEGKTKALRQWRMKEASDVQPELVRQYVTESMEHVEAGKAIAPKRKKPLVIPPELQAVLDDDADLKQQFATLTPGKQREYTTSIEEVKTDAAKTRRLEKAIPLIRAGKGLHDQYR